MTYQGGCLCGAVRWKAQGEPVNVRACHCTLCQRAVSAPFYARAFFTEDAVTIEGNVEKFPTSENIWRVFCRECGTRLFSHRADGSGIGIALATFEDLGDLAPTEHIFVSSKVGWLKLDDGLPQYQERAPA